MLNLPSRAQLGFVSGVSVGAWNYTYVIVKEPGCLNFEVNFLHIFSAKLAFNFQSLTSQLPKRYRFQSDSLMFRPQAILEVTCSIVSSSVGHYILSVDIRVYFVKFCSRGRILLLETLGKHTGKRG